MSLKRTCLLCGDPVPIQRRMSLFCRESCEHRYDSIKAAPPPPSRRDAKNEQPEPHPPSRKPNPPSAHRS